MADGLTAMALFMGLSIVRFGSPGWRETWASVGIDPFVAAAGYGLVLVGALWLQGLYRLRTRLSIRREVIDVLVAILLLAVVVFTTLYLLKLPNVSRLFLLLLFSFQAGLTTDCLAASYPDRFDPAPLTRLQRPVHPGGWGQPSGQAFADSVEGHIELGLRPIGYLAAPNDPSLPATWAAGGRSSGPSTTSRTSCTARVVDEVAVCLAPRTGHSIEPITRLCEEEGKIVRIPIETTSIMPAGRPRRGVRRHPDPVARLRTGPGLGARRQTPPRHRCRASR